MNPFYEKKEASLEIYLNPNLTFPEHLHEHVEILLVKDSCIEVTVASESKLLSQGDLAVIFPGQIHSYRCVKSGDSLLLLFDPSLSESYAHILRNFLPESAFLYSETVPDDVELAFDRLFTYFFKKIPKHLNQDIASIELGSAWISVLLANLMPLLQLKERNQPESMELTHRLVIYIAEHFREPLSLDVLASALHVNKYYLSHIFSTHFKVGFRQYLNQIRLNHALYLLQTTELSITQIWEASGFNSQRSFHRFFLKIMGMTPMEYRKKLR